jgi:glycyl-tRNA synthetase
MKFPIELAPYKVCILPLIKKVHSQKALEIYKGISKNYMCDYDESGNIGKRYRRQDVYGTPYCITIDDQTMEKNTVTIRDRDTMKQDIIEVENIGKYIASKF